jgi:hypothetical protein|tara:strand:+ start:367 stop:1206 length:840 start_codon:yes stop_codon:yes gene_type:complete
LAYLGNRPAEAYSAFQKQDFSTSATTSYTLDHPVSNQNEIALFINFVRQEPTAAYTASGTTLTLTSATSSSDDMYCIYLGKAVQTVNPPSGSVGSSQVAASIITGQTALGATPADTDELLISDAGTLKKVDYSYLKSANTPAFVAYKTSNQSISNTTFTKITFEAEQLDSNSTFASSKFTPGVAGYYFIGAVWRYDTGTDFPDGRFILYKNGSAAIQSSVVNDDANGMTFSAIIYSDADDYFEMYGRQDSGGSVNINGNGSYLGDSTQAQFFGFRIIGA